MKVKISGESSVWKRVSNGISQIRECPAGSNSNQEKSWTIYPGTDIKHVFTVVRFNTSKEMTPDAGAEKRTT